MKSSLEHPLPPRLQQFDMKIQNRTACFKCETHVRENTLVNSEYRDQPLIQNYYSYKVNNQLVKVTKIRIGHQLVTMIDRLSFKKCTTQQQVQEQKNRSYQVTLPRESALPQKKSVLSVKTRKILKLFSKWVKQSKPQINDIVQEIYQNCVNQLQLKLQLRENVQIRAAWREFIIKMKQEKINKNTYLMLKRWIRSILSQEGEQNKGQTIQEQIIKTA